VLLCLIGVAVGLASGWALWRPKPAPIEPHAPEIQLRSGAVVLEREPDAPVPVPIRLAAKEFDPRAILERAVTIRITPPARIVDDEPCPPMDLDLGIVKLPDDTRRVIVRSRDGEVAGLDIPVHATAPVQAKRWAAGALYNPRREDYGAFIDRDVGPLRVGLDVIRSREDGDLSALIRVGFRF